MTALTLNDTSLRKTCINVNKKLAIVSNPANS